MTESLVNILKIIQIEVKQRSPSGILLCSFRIAGQILLTAHSVIQSGQKVNIRLLFQLFLINFLLCLILQAAKKHRAFVQPFHSGINKLIPFFPPCEEDLPAALFFADFLLQKLIKASVRKLRSKVAAHTPVYKYLLPGGKAPDIHGILHVVQHRLKGRIGFRQLAFVLPPGEDILQYLNRIIQELDLLHLPVPLPFPLVKAGIHANAPSHHDRQHHDGLDV